MQPSVQSIYIAATGGAPMTLIDSAELEAGRGIVGDRYHSGSGKFYKKLVRQAADDWQVTLIESEELDRYLSSVDFDLGHGDFRRNIVTAGIRLNDLIGRRFTIGNVALEGIRLCEPCGYLSKLLKRQLVPVMNGRSGLRAKIISGGQIAIGDAIAVWAL